MKEAKDEEYYLLIPNPLTGEKEEFDLERGSNVSLILRLIRKRDKVAETSSENFKKLKKLREKHNVEDLEKRTQELLNKISSLDNEEFESEESFNDRLDELHKELNDLKDEYPEEVVDLQNKIGKLTQDMDRIGIKICTLILNPTDGVPDEYISKKDYIEEMVIDDEDVRDIITFFLNTLSFTTRSHKDRVIQMKSRSNGTMDRGKGA